MSDGPIIKRRRVSGDRGSQKEVDSQVTENLEESPLQKAPSRNRLWHIFVIIAGLMMIVGWWSKSLYTPGQHSTSNDYSPLLERLKSTAILTDNSYQKHREANTTLESAKALGQSELVEISKEIEQAANNELVKARERFAEVLSEVHAARHKNPSEFDKAAVSFVEDLQTKQLKTQAKELSEALKKIRETPDTADPSVFVKIANGIS